jgi:hypothetical protein
MGKPIYNRSSSAVMRAVAGVAARGPRANDDNGKIVVVRDPEPFNIDRRKADPATTCQDDSDSQQMQPLRHSRRLELEVPVRGWISESPCEMVSTMRRI